VAAATKVAYPTTGEAAVTFRWFNIVSLMCCQPEIAHADALPITSASCEPRDIVHLQPDELAGPNPGVDEHSDHCFVATVLQTLSLAGGEQCDQFSVGQDWHQAPMAETCAPAA
jgi:hypothetical protein